MGLLALFFHIFIRLRIDARGALEITAEIRSGRETEFIRGFLYCLFGVCVHEQFGTHAAQFAEQFRKILLVIIYNAA